MSEYAKIASDKCHKKHQFFSWNRDNHVEITVQIPTKETNPSESSLILKADRHVCSKKLL